MDASFAEAPRDSTTLSSKGQVVITKNIRKHLGLKPGTRFFEYVRDSEVVLKPVKSVGKMKGFLKGVGGFKDKTAGKIMGEIDSGWS